MDTKFYICKGCGNIIRIVKKGTCTPKCCGQPMEELIPNSADASKEKHIPAININGKNVEINVGAAAHPMTDEHLIEWIYLETEKGGQIKYLTAADAPKASFVLTDDKATAAYAYCNLHGLWKAEI